jgi:hypothetical protein
MKRHALAAAAALLIVETVNGFSVPSTCFTRSKTSATLSLRSSHVTLHSTPDPVDDGSDADLELDIDSFLSGDFDFKSPTDAPAPHPELTPADVIDLALRSLRRDLNEPTPNYGAAIFQRFQMPLTRAERWGDSSRDSSRVDPWKDILRGAVTVPLLAQRLRASDFSSLLDWQTLDVSDGAFDPRRDLVGNPSVAFVNAALYFGSGSEPVLIQFILQRAGGVWLIDTARKSEMDIFRNGLAEEDEGD